MSVKKLSIIFVAGILLFSMFIGGSKGKAEKTELLISAAVSMTDVLEELATTYENKHKDVSLIFTFGGSGTLQTQIEEGAPVDIFISAAQKQIDRLEEKGLIVEGTRKELLHNKVVLITPVNNQLNIKSFDDLLKDKVGKIGLGEPIGVPAGQYSEEVFRNLNIIDRIKGKFIYASDVRTVLTWVENGQVDCGLVYHTDALTSDKIKIVSEGPADSHTPIIYPVAVIKDCKNINLAKDFIDYLSSDEAIQIFNKYGFEMY